jgi:hypothetical protein
MFCARVGILPSAVAALAVPAAGADKRFAGHAGDDHAPLK